MYALSLAFAVNASAAAAIFFEAFGFAAGLDDPGFNGRGGGARSGSELSHLVYAHSRQLGNRKMKYAFAYIGTDARPESEMEG